MERKWEGLFRRQNGKGVECCVRMLQLCVVGNGEPWMFLEQEHDVVKLERSLWCQHKKGEEDTRPYIEALDRKLWQ